ncbi:rhamnulokinase [Gordonia terrae]|uniref:Rhamnulokinase n=2 Tax=Gordonia terrae TaxID=2055 RepID=A0AAD0NV65_9ACTN|nr:rhamnulokinase family protein [Gordonia terrae]VTR07288.1 L-fuculokinase [Clostridioides difficile]ANY22820.1 carbohydrate kinase [Gordonia terrae]AWO83556.1 rhamnulokinase [Gordonia terrae]VTS42857.1 Rhamnulokinase [Gordonia terrae]GAB43452.1 rhamnulokinase [Gordonia terrae NBRC 100016]
MSRSTRSAQVAAIDLGATSGRVMLADVSQGRLELEQVARFANDPVHVWNGRRSALHWDVPGLFRAASAGLAEAARQSDDLVGIGVDSWAVDYALLRDGRMLGLPHHYRDDRTAAGVDAVHAELGPVDLYLRNGLQFLPFTTVYQLAAEKADGLLDQADNALLIPDLITYWLTGRRGTERTNASTTGLLAVNGQWDTAMMERLGLPVGLFPEIVETGSDQGPLLAEVAERLGLSSSTRVTAVASHDTASAVAAIPMDPARAAYISCGTWGLVGVELTEPVLSRDGWKANFTNEVGADGRIRYLHNVMGLWLLSETVRQYQREGYRADLGELLAQAAEVTPTVDVFDTDDARFLPPGDMPARIRGWYDERGMRPPMTRAEMVRAIVESLASAFADGVEKAAALSGIPVETVHLVGGGSQNRLLCQLTADRVGLPVQAGPVEATALGNVLLTARAHELIDGDLEAMRTIVADRFPPQHYAPRRSRGTRARAAVGAGKA